MGIRIKVNTSRGNYHKIKFAKNLFIKYFYTLFEQQALGDRMVLGYLKIHR